MIRTRPGSLIESVSDLQVLEQNTASEAGFLLRKTVFRHAYPALGLAVILKEEGSYVPSRPLNEVVCLSTLGMSYTDSGFDCLFFFSFVSGSSQSSADFFLFEVDGIVLSGSSLVESVAIEISAF